MTTAAVIETPDAGAPRRLTSVADESGGALDGVVGTCERAAAGVADASARGLTAGGDEGWTVLTSARVDAVVELLQRIATDVDDAERVALLRGLERLRHTASAAQLGVMLDLDEQRHDAREETGLPTDRRSAARGVAAEIGAALGCSATAATRRLGLARVADRELPRTTALHRRGLVGEDRVPPSTRRPPVWASTTAAPSTRSWRPSRRVSPSGSSRGGPARRPTSWTRSRPLVSTSTPSGSGTSPDDPSRAG